MAAFFGSNSFLLYIHSCSSIETFLPDSYHHEALCLCWNLVEIPYWELLIIPWRNMEALNIAGETGGISWIFPLFTKVETMNSLLRKPPIHILPCSLPGPGFLVLHPFPTTLLLHKVPLHPLLASRKCTHTLCFRSIRKQSRIFYAHTSMRKSKAKSQSGNPKR